MKYVYIHRMKALPISNRARHSEWDMIHNIAHNNAFPVRLLHSVGNKILQKQQLPLHTEPPTQRRNWVTFTFYSPLLYKITNITRNTGINIDFKPTNTLQHHLRTYTPADNLGNSGIYRLHCNTYNKLYVGQSGRYI
jgi:hypothetical protein